MKAKPYSWAAHDQKQKHPKKDMEVSPQVMEVNDNEDAVINQEGNQVSDTDQISSETIIVRDSCEVEITSHDTQIAVSLQAALQVAIAIVINITIADSDRAEKVTQQLLQETDLYQLNEQELVIENSRKVKVTTHDTDIAVSIQLLFQILVAIVVSIDIF